MDSHPERQAESSFPDRLVNRRAPLVKLGGLFEGVGKTKNRHLIEILPEELEADGKRVTSSAEVDLRAIWSRIEVYFQP